MLLAAGDPDLGFASDGAASVQVESGQHQLKPVVVAQSPGDRTVVVYETRSGLNTVSSRTTIVARYNADGTPDPTFADIGSREVIGRNGNGEDEVVVDAVVDDLGNIYVLGEIEDPRDDPSDVSITKFAPDGTLSRDLTPGSESIFSGSFYDFSTDDNTVVDRPKAIGLDSEDRLYVASESGQGSVVARILPNGTVDPTYGVDGIVSVDPNPGQAFSISDLAVDGDGTVVVIGEVAGQPLATRLLADGSVDNAFGVGGTRTIALPGGATTPPKLHVDSAGRLLIGATSGDDFAATRLSASGAIDAGFGSSGTAVIDAGGTDLLVAITSDAAGRVVLGGNTESAGEQNVAIARLTPSGSADATVGIGGVVVRDLGEDDDAFGDLVGRADGTLIAAVVAPSINGDHGDASLIGLDTSLQNDASFGGGGTVDVALFGETDIVGVFSGQRYRTRALADDSVILIHPRGSIKVLSDGTPDPSYGDDGVAFHGIAIQFGRAIVRDDGSHIIAGSPNTFSGSYRFIAVDANGNLDASFGNGGVANDTVDQVFFTDVIEAADGGFIVLGNTSASLPPAEQGMVITKYNASGQRDTSFGTGGQLIIQQPSDENYSGRTLLADPSGNLVITGTSDDGSTSGSRIIFASFTPTGQINSSFGNNGIINTATRVESVVSSVQIDDGGYIVSSLFGDITTIHRFNSIGFEDRTFGFNGSLSLNDPTINATDFRGEINVDGDGGILIPSNGRASFDVLRLTPDGKIDPLFGDFGVASIPLAAEVSTKTLAEISFDSQGRIVSGAGVTLGALFSPRPTLFRFSNSATDCGVAGCIRFEEQLPVVSEGDGEAIVTLTREGGTTGNVSVRLRTLRERAVEALPGEDYTPVDTRVDFVDGQQTATVRIPIVSDDIDEAPDTILLEIDDAQGGALLENPQRARLTIERQGPNPVAFDSTFGDRGITDIDFAQNSPIVSDIVQQPDGKIVVVGSDGFGSGDFLTMRFNVDGSLDDTFSDDGIVRTDFQLERDLSRAVAMQSDGKIIVAGESQFAVDVGLAESRSTLIRLLPDGRIDRMFGSDGNGRVVNDDLELEAYTDVLVLPDDSMFVASEINRFEQGVGNIRAIVVQKLFADGSLDASFGNNGQVRIDDANASGTSSSGVDGKQLAIDPSGRLIVAGSFIELVGNSSISRPLVIAMSQSGVLDTSFGDQGLAIFREFGDVRSAATGMSVAENGQIYVAVNNDLTVLSVTPNGQLDTNFDGDGIASIEAFADAVDTVTDITITPNGRIWVSGVVETASIFGSVAVASFLPSGRPDPAIDGVGFKVYPRDSGIFESGAMTVLNGGEVLVAAATSVRPAGAPSIDFVSLIKVAGGDGAGELNFEFGEVEVDENRGLIELQVLRTDGGQGQVSVTYATRNGAALAGDDYVQQTGELLFVDGQLSAGLTILLEDNAAIEGPENFFVDLSSPVGGATLGATDSVEVTIVDGPGTIQFASPVVAAAESQFTSSITLTRQGGSDGEVSVRVRSVGGSATVGADYVAVDQVVTFVDGQTEASFALGLIDDPITEGIETIDLELSQPAGGATIGSQGTTLVRLFDVEPFQATTAGALDLSFSGDGRARPVTTPPFDEIFTFASVNPIGMANRSGGSFVVADQFFRLTGVRDDGTVDNRFGTDGIANANVESLGVDSQRSEDFAVDSQGRFVVVGRRSLGFDADFVVARFLPSGELDDSFANNGLAVLDLGGDDRAFAVAIDGNDGIFVAGSTGGVFQRQIGVVHFNNSGDLNNSFGNAGIVKIDGQERFEEATAITVEPDGSVLVAGHEVRELQDVGGIAVSSADILLTRLSANGAIDTSYGTAGRAMPEFVDRTGNITDDDRVRKLIPLQGGKTLLIGSTDAEFLVARFNGDGTLDTSFGRGDGFVTGVLSPGGRGAQGLDFAFDAILGIDGSITVVGESRTAFGSEQLSVARLTADGVPDPTFGARGGRNFSGLDFVDGGRAVMRAEGGGLLVATLNGGVVKLIETTVCPAAGCVQFTTLDASETEFDQTVELRVARPIDASEGEVTVQFFTIDGTATAGTDYVATTGTITFGDTEATQVIRVPILGDSIREGDETFFVVLAAPTGGAVLGAQFVVPVAILDNEFSAADNLPNLSIFGGFFAEDSGEINVRLSFDSTRSQPIVVDYTTVPVGTATPGVDYIPSSGTITINPNDSSAFVPVPVVLDDEIEPDETFQIVLSGVTGANLTRATGTVTIADVVSTDCEGGPGTPHPSFGEDGVGRFDPDPSTTGDVGPIDTFLADDGRIVQIGSLLDSDSGISVVRYNANGTPDASFGTAGVVRIPTVQNGGVLPDPSIEDGSEFAEAVRMLADGSVLVFGRAFQDSLFNLFVLKLRPNGTLDPTFGTGGIQFTPLVNLQVDFTSGTVAPDGSVYLVGSAGVQWESTDANTYSSVVPVGFFNPVGFRTQYRSSVMMLRLDGQGQLDTTFGIDGSVVFGGASGIESIEFDSQGRPLVLINGFAAESSSFDKSLIRLTSAGAIDTQFSDRPFVPEVPFPSDVQIPPGATEEHLFNDASIDDFTVAPNGDLIFFGGLSQTVVSPDDDSVIFSDFSDYLFRVTPDLQPVTSFADQGVSRFDTFDFNLFVDDVAAQPDGRVLLMGQAFGQLGTIRTHPSGFIDQGFGGTGLQRVPGTFPNFGSVDILRAASDQTLVAFGDGSSFAVASLSSGPASGVIRLERSTTSVAEDGQSLEMLVRRVCGVDGPVSVQVATANGSALAGADYTALSQTVNFADGEFVQTITIPIIDDQTFDGDLDFTVNLSSPTGGATIETVITTTVTIIDDEQPGRLQFAGGPVTVSETDGTATVTIERIDGDGGEVSVLVTPTGNATNGEDYNFPVTTVTFANGVTSQDVVIPIVDDALVEPDAEVIRLALSNPGGGAELGFLTTTTVEILDDDVLVTPPQGTFSISATSSNVEEFAGFVTYTITRTNGSQGEVTVNYSAIGETATNNRDFQGGSGSILLVEGQTERSFVIPILDDAEIEGDETFVVSLTSLSGGRIDTNSSSVTTTIIDDDIENVLLDFGDAPETFGTTLAADGPSHGIGTFLSLGENVDSEDDGLPSVNADGDTNDDGVTGLAQGITAGASATIQVNVRMANNAPTALLQGWIDFSGDGVFSEDERVISNAAYTNDETRAFDIVVPAGAVTGQSYARFRVSTLASLFPTGNAPDGEVEDYVVTINESTGQNTPPIVDAGGPYQVNEGSDLVLTATGTDAQDGSNLTYEWDLDFVSGSFAADRTGRVITLSQVLDPPSSLNVAVRATDSGGLTDIDEATITIINLAPVINADASEVVAAPNTQTSAMGSFSDPGNDPVTLSASVGNVTGSGGRYTWTGPSNAGLVTITATDDDLATATTSFTVRESAANTPPSVDAGGPYTVDEGETLSLSATGSDAEDGNSLTYQWDLSFDGTFNVDATGQNVSINRVLDPPSTFTVAVRATDSGGLAATDTAAVTVVNLPPNIMADSATVIVQPGSTATAMGSFSDPGDDPVTLSASVGSVTGNAARYTWTGPSTAGTVTITATDDDNASATTTFTVQEAVNNPPTVEAGGPYAVDEGGSVQLVAQGMDVETDVANLIYAWDLDGDGAFDDANSRVVTLQNVQDPPTSFQVAVRVTDNGNASATDTATVTVNNLPPTIRADRAFLVATEGTQVTAAGSFSDPGDDPLQLDASIGTVTGNNGRYRWTGPSDAGSVTITVTDDNGATDSTTFTIREIPVGGGSVPWLPGVDPLAARTDVNRDGRTSALDALMVINFLGIRRSVEGDAASGNVDVSSYDVNNDGRVSARDALAVINRISLHQTVAESEEIDRVLGDVETWVDEREGSLF